MGVGFRVADLDQSLLLPESMRDWLPDDHLVWLIVDVVAGLDLSCFEASYRGDGRGGVAYHPRWMVTLLLFAYTQGIHSSRRIEQSVRENVAFRIACANQCPDHATIARFRCRHEDDLKQIFSHSLQLCVGAGLVDIGQLALDGTKIKADASGFRNVDKTLLEKMIGDYFAHVDDFDVPDCNVLPAQLGSAHSRAARLIKAREKIAEIEAAEDAEYEAKLAKHHRVDRAGRRRGGRVKHPRESKNYRLPRVNTSDPDSKIMKTAAGFVQGYNLQAVTDSNQIIVAVDLCCQPNDAHQLAPMMDLAVGNLAECGLGVPGAMLADSGYFQPVDLEYVTRTYPKTELFIASNGANMKRLKQRGRIPKSATVAQLVDRKMATKYGKTRYRPRKWMIEPVFSRLKHQLNLKEFNRPSLKSALSETYLTAAAHNILKYYKLAKNQ